MTCRLERALALVLWLPACAAPPQAATPETSAAALTPEPAGHLVVQLAWDGESLSWVQTRASADPLPKRRGTRPRPGGWRVDVLDATKRVLHTQQVPDPRRVRVPPPQTGGPGPPAVVAAGRVDVLVRLPRIDGARLAVFDMGSGKRLGTVTVPSPP